MIRTVRNIISEDPVRETWKYLRLFLDVPSVTERIKTLHNVPKGKHEKSTKKQAEQINYCIRQAQEYFQAAAKVSLATRPTLLYYGAANLSQALILLRLSGDHSIDRLREEKKHNHHGLEIIRGTAAEALKGGSVERFLESLQVRCFVNNDKPWGHFALFYKSLVPSVFREEADLHDSRITNTLLRRDFARPCADLLPQDTFLSQKLDVMSIFKTLPDLCADLIEMKIQPNLCLGNIKTVVRYEYDILPESEQADLVQPEEKKAVKISARRDYFIDGILVKQKDHLLSFYREKIPNLKLEADFGNNLRFSVNSEYPNPNNEKIYYPDLVEDISGKKYFILAPESYMHEPAAMFVALYCFGMLSRYYPDVWMKAIDTNVRIAELSNSFLNIAYRKFPNLILDQLSWVKHYIHS